MNNESKGMQILLVIASFIIMLSDIALFASDVLIDNMIAKFGIAVAIPTALLILSKMIEKNFKLELCSFYIYLMSMLTYLISFTIGLVLATDELLYFIVGNYELNIFVPMGVFGAIISLISYFIYKKRIFIKTLYLSCMLFIDFFAYSIFLNYFYTGYTSIVILAILVLANIFMKKEYLNFVTISNFFFIFIAFLFGDMYELFNVIMLPCLTFITLIINIRRQPKIFMDILSFIAMIITFFGYIGNLSDYEPQLFILVPLATLIIIDMLFSVLNVGKDKKEAIGFKVILDILTIGMMLIAIDRNQEIIPMILLVLSSSIISTYALKSDRYEQYVLPFKVILCVIAMVLALKEYINVDDIIFILAVNIVSIAGYLISKSKMFKVMFNIATVISLIAAMIAVGNGFEFVVTLAMLLFNYYVFFILEEKAKIFKYLMFGAIVLFVVMNTWTIDIPLTYLVIALVYGIIHIVDKDKVIKNISMVGVLVLMLSFINTTIDNDLSSTLKIIIEFLTILYIFKLNKLDDAFSVLLMIALGLYAFSTDYYITIFVFIGELLFLIFTSIGKNKSFYHLMIIFLVIAIIRSLKYTSIVPIFIYMIIIGLIVISIIFITMKRNDQKEKLEKENQMVLEDIIKEEQKTQEESYNKQNDDNCYCKKCGAILSKKANFCKTCGNKIDK